ncbi:MAG: molecular chaperone HtpG [Arsenophonus sp.]|nr:MAG: molecular chaperone HtpG [Arsenophonus sp.]
MNKKEIYNFQSEVKQLLHLMIHSLYSNKEIFLRELISNASDALDKLRFKAISNPKLYENNSKLEINIEVDKKMKTICISDNGIGMTKDEIIKNLGTIAKSGTKEFLKSLDQKQSKNQQLIGQFGVGFYSSFIVSKKVIVKTKAAGNPSNQGVYWESDGQGEYFISNEVKDNRGTDVILYLKDQEKDFLEDTKIRLIIQKYSDHIAFPIKIKNIDKKNKNNISWDQINKAQTLWDQNPKKISEKEYIEFYKNLTNDYNDPLLWLHNKVESTQHQYISLIYIPKKSLFDLWNRDHKYGLKLYINRVLIMEEAEQFIPGYLRFIRGLIDSKDLPLNISREIIQNNPIVNSIRNSLTKKILKILKKLSENQPDKYQKFWKEFGLILKEGPAEDLANKDEILKLLRFSSTYNNNEIQNVSLENYIQRMNHNQKKIYYITADNYLSAKNSPHLEFFKKNNIEVLLLFDRIDEWLISYLPKFKDKELQSVTKNNISLESINQKEIEKNKISNNETENFIKKVKKILEKKVKDVKITNRLTETPVILTTDHDDMSTQMAKLLSTVGQSTKKILYNFEINFNHPLIQKINNIKNDSLFNEYISMLFEQALLIEQNSLDDINSFIKKVNKLLLNNN